MGGFDERRFPCDQCTKRRNHAVARPDLRVSGGQPGGAKAVRCDAGLEDVQGDFVRARY